MAQNADKFSAAEQGLGYIYQTRFALLKMFELPEHANLRDQWFQDSLVEQPWKKPPALVPEDWPMQE